MMVHWFKIHPEYLIKECHDLSHDSNYQELFQIRDELLVSHGNIMVRLNETKKHPVLIIYPSATPYVLPLVFPLNRELTENEVAQVAAGHAPLAESIKQFYEYRHQTGGVLCFLEWESFDDGGQYFGIATILQRVAEWFRGHVTKEFPPDSQEVAYCAHFNRLNSKLQFLYPEQFVATPSIEGEFYAGQFYDLPKENVNLMPGLFWGAYISGINQAGLIVEPPRDIRFTSYIRHSGLVNSLDIDTKPDLVDRLVKEEKLLKGVWFDIENEPPPFEDFNDLVVIIGKGDLDTGRDRLARTAFSYMKTMPSTLSIAIRFPNRCGDKEFQLFIVNKIESPHGVLIGVPPNEAVVGLISNYKIVEAVRCEKFTPNTFFQRNAQRANHEILKDKVVNFIGVGALGSEMADSLSKAGVGSIILFDNQFINAHNTVRHLVGTRFVGMPKVAATQVYLEEHNPFVDVRHFITNVTHCDMGIVVPEGSLTISSIADDNIEGHLNQQLVIARKSAFYARALRGGKAGRIVRVIPGTDACLNCLRLYRQEGKQFIEIPQDETLPIGRNECNHPILPASAADLKLISALASRLIIDQLQYESNKANHWIWSSEIIPETVLIQPFSLNSQFIAPHPDCQFCSWMENPVVSITNSTLNTMVKFVKSKAGVETGGVLAGFYGKNGVIHVEYASAAGPNAIETVNKFEKDIPYCQKFLDDLFMAHGDKAIYLGEWHSHPGEDNSPSNTDLDSLTGISNQKNYLTDKPIMIIFTQSGRPSCSIHPTGKMYRFVDIQTTES